MRIPGLQRSEFPFDGDWQARFGPVEQVTLGAPVTFCGPVVGDQLTTSHVVSARPLPDDEVPPLGKIMFKAPDDVN